MLVAAKRITAKKEIRRYILFCSKDGTEIITTPVKPINIAIHLYAGTFSFRKYIAKIVVISGTTNPIDTATDISRCVKQSDHKEAFIPPQAARKIVSL